MQNNKAYLYWLLLLLVSLIGCGKTELPTTASKQRLVVCILDSFENHPLIDYVQVLPDSSSGLVLENIVQPQTQGRFLGFKDSNFKAQSNKTYWGKIQLENRLPNAEKHLEWVCNVSGTFTDMTLYTLASDSTWTAHPNGTFLPDYKKDFTPTRSGNWFKVVLPPQKVVTLYFKGTSCRPAMPPSFYAYAQPSELFFEKMAEGKTYTALFTGFLLMMLLFNMIAFYFGRDRSFIYYSGYILTVVVYTAYSTDNLEDSIGGFLFQENPEYINLFKISLYIGLMCYLGFIRRFLDLHSLLPKWDRYFHNVQRLGWPLMLFFVLLSFRYNFSHVIDDRLTLFYIALVSFSGLLFIYPLFKTKSTKGYFIVAGIAIISISYVITLYSRMYQTPFSVFYLKLGTVLEMLIFSTGLAYRQKKQEEEKQKADFALKESLLQQEKKQVEAERLKELDGFKTRFYTNITHEFRTPLTVIMGIAEQLKGQDVEKTLIRRNSENLLRLVNQMLDLSKLESGSLSLHEVHQDINVYLQYLTESFYSTATQKGIRLVFHSEKRAIFMDYDEEKVQQIVYNLLSNALKFTENAGKIILFTDTEVLEEQPFLKLKVKDTGSGIAEQELKKIFDRFYQADNEGNSSGGTGIGLALVKELVELMGGRIKVNSIVGEGTEFLLYLPIRTKVAVSMPKTTVTKHLSKASEEEEEEQQETSSIELPQLLIIEDNPDIISYLKILLDKRYVLLEAKNGVEGIEKAIEHIPDIILSDVMMPLKNGYEVCDTLKQDERTSHIPIILLTAKVAQQDKVLGLKYGADAYLNKPFDKDELFVRLENLVHLRQQLQKRYAQHLNQIHEDSSTPITDSVQDAFLEKLHMLILEDLSDAEFGVPQLAAAAQLSQMQLYRKLKALTGKTPSQFIRSYRLHQGRELLKKGDLTVAEVAYEVGFTDPNYFSRTFHEEFKINPSQYLK